MRYITKVNDTHVIEINGINHKVEESVIAYSGTEDKCFSFNGCRINQQLGVQGIPSGCHLAVIVLAVEVTKFIQSQQIDERAA